MEQYKQLYKRKQKLINSADKLLQSLKYRDSDNNIVIYPHDEEDLDRVKRLLAIGAEYDKTLLELSYLKSPSSL